ncbi:MAG TPA: S8/S53 family peptidase [Bacteroidia bacterium]|jgi:hypothetical protein|nr:S8/S53 family peptidase [Bacteroidia bacterium]
MKRIITLSIACAFVGSVFAKNPNAPSIPYKQKHTPVSELTPDDYMANTMILNVLPEFRDQCTDNSINIPEVNDFLAMIGSVNVQRKFTHSKRPDKKFNDWGAPMIDITLIYEIKFTSAMNLDKAISKMFDLGYFEYVEPHYIEHIALIPTDASATNAQSYYIYITHCAGSTQSGWDISTGSSSVTIGIVDTGTELTHADLTNQIQHNLADPIGGGDNDNDGYVDNYNGWDVAMNDNDPTWQGNAHGVAVCGDADAQVNGGGSVAGPGFNCKFLPVKIADASGALTASYDGIVYAADHGADVINCSWGGVGGGSYGQSIIDYATNNQDALVCCAAGNDGIDELFYPSGYDNAMSVCATTNTDAHASFTNYNYTVDVASPGNSIYSTWNGNSYWPNSGTSMASPVCAGICAVVRAFYPSYNAMQTMHRVMQTADNIYSVSGNTSAIYTDKLGSGRVNLYRALTDPVVESVGYSNIAFTDNNDNAFVAGDTLRLTGLFTNYLATTTNLVGTLSVVSGGTYVSLLDNSTTVGALGTMGTATHTADPFQIKILPAAPVNADVVFKLTMTDGAYSTNVYFDVIVNVDYINVTVNDVWTTITSKGLIGYNQPSQAQGLGFDYQHGGTLMYESSLMIGTSSTKVNDMVRGATAGNTDVDFASQVAVRQQTTTPVSDFDTYGWFRDNVSTTPLPVTVHHTSYAWTPVPHSKYVIVQYVIKNTGASTLSNLYAGIFSDWDVDAATYANDKAAFDAVNKMGYVWCTNAGGKYVGIKLLTNTAPVNHYAIDNVSGGGGGVDITAGFTTAQKYTVLSTSRATAGGAGTGNDVCDVVSSGPFTISAGDSVKVAFALLAGDDLTDLQNSAVDAQSQYDNLILGIADNAEGDPSGLFMYPNPTSGEMMINYSVAEAGNTELKILNASGQVVRLISTGDKQPGDYVEQFDGSSLADGIYFLQFTSNGNVSTRKMVISH